MKSFLLGLLLLVAAADDALVCAMPWVEDTTQAAENNEFLSQPHAAGHRLPRRTSAFPAHRPVRHDFFPLRTSRPGPHHEAPAPFPGPDSLYVLMSLQR